VLMVVVGFVVGFSFHDTTVLEILAGVVLMLLFGFAFSWIAALIGLSVPNAEVAQSAGFIWLFPLTFASSAFVPVDSMPDWLQAFADINPVTVCVNAVRELWLGVPSGDDILWTVVWSLGLVAIFAPLATARYRRTSRA
jgi:ABC-type multidrug transport system permease subunit